jgi:hypothetical protein
MRQRPLAKYRRIEARAQFLEGDSPANGLEHLLGSAVHRELKTHAGADNALQDARRQALSIGRELDRRVSAAQPPRLVDQTHDVFGDCWFPAREEVDVRSRGNQLGELLEDGRGEIGAVVAGLSKRHGAHDTPCVAARRWIDNEKLWAR